MDTTACLPDELWLTILHAGIGKGWECRDVCSVGLVNRRLKHLSSTNDLWAKLWSKEWPADVKKEDPGCWKRVFRFRYEREATQRKMAHSRKVLRLQSKASVLRKDARLDDRALRDEHVRLSSVQEKQREVERQRQASSAVQVWQPLAVHHRHSTLVEQQPLPPAAQAEALRHEQAVCELRIAQLRRGMKRKLAEADEIDSRVAHLNYDPVTALAEERQARRRDAARRVALREAAAKSVRVEKSGLGLSQVPLDKNTERMLNGMGAEAEESALDKGKLEKRVGMERVLSVMHRGCSTSYCSGGSVDQRVGGDGALVNEGESREAKPRRRTLRHIEWSKVGMRPASPQLSTINSKQRI